MPLIKRGPSSASWQICSYDQCQVIPDGFHPSPGPSPSILPTRRSGKRPLELNRKEEKKPKSINHNLAGCYMADLA